MAPRDEPPERSGYEDPAQQPTGAPRPSEPRYNDPEKGRWPPHTLFLVVAAVLLTGLVILTVLGLIAG